jgi:hypothetical protein
MEAVSTAGHSTAAADFMGADLAEGASMAGAADASLQNAEALIFSGSRAVSVWTKSCLFKETTSW